MLADSKQTIDSRRYSRREVIGDGLEEGKGGRGERGGRRKEASLSNLRWGESGMPTRERADSLEESY